MGILENKRVLVIGASGGIGLACAEEFLAEGAIVAGSYRRENDKSKALKEAHGDHFSSFQLDLADQSSIQGILKGEIKKLGGADALVNAAGIVESQLLHAASPENWEKTLEINLMSAFHIIQAVTRPLASAGGGSIVQLSSVFGLIGGAGQASYCASKAGLIGLVRAACAELARWNVRVNAVAPGLIESEMTEKLGDKYRERFLSGIPLHRAGTVREVAQLCAFLASDKSTYITGQVMVIDGGMHATI